MQPESAIVERVVTERGELVLRRRGEAHEIISNGVFLMDTRNGESERRLVRAALAAVPAAGDLLIGGLGVGFSLDEATRVASLSTVDVVEIEPTVIGWYRTHLGGPAADDPRVRIVCADLLGYLAAEPNRYDAVCLDIDNGPEWTVTDANRRLYGDSGLDLVKSRLRPGGVLTVWSAAASAGFAARLTRHFGTVRVVPVPVPRGEPDVIYVAGPLA